jgi:hypothetical protein
MSTKTEELKDIVVEVDPASTTAAELLQKVAEASGWAQADTLLRLEGFEDPWERAIYNGRELKSDATLAEQGVVAGGKGSDAAVVVTVRRVLVADGWKIKAVDDDDDSDSEEEEDF